MLSVKNNKNIVKVSEPINIINRSNTYNNAQFNTHYNNQQSIVINNTDDYNNTNKYNINELSDYKLDFNKFDPSKFSPPNDWTLRLQTRLKKYNDTNNLATSNANKYTNYFFDNK